MEWTDLRDDLTGGGGGDSYLDRWFQEDRMEWRNGMELVEGMELKEWMDGSG